MPELVGTDALAKNTARKPTPTFLAIFKRLLALVFVLWLIVCLMLIVFQRKLVFVGHGQRVSKPLAVEMLSLDAGRGFDVQVPTSDGLALNGWVVLADSAASMVDGLSGSRPVVLYCSGNAGNRAKRARAIQLFSEIGVDVCLVDYRGYADNSGTPSEEAFAADALQTWKYLTEELNVSSDRIVVYGESLGGGVATRLTATLCETGTPPAALMLRATFASLVETASYHYPFVPVRFILKDRFPSVDFIGNVSCPIVHFHGTRDRIVPYVHGKELIAAARPISDSGIAKQFVTLPETGHNDILHVSYDLVQQETKKFLQRLNLIPSGQ